MPEFPANLTGQDRSPLGMRLMSATSPLRRLALLCFFAMALDGCQMLSHQDDDAGGLAELAPAGSSRVQPRQEAPPAPPPPLQQHDDIVNSPSHEDAAPPPPAAPQPAPGDTPSRPAHSINTVAEAAPPTATPPRAHLRQPAPVPVPLGESTVEATAEAVVATPPQARLHHPVPVPLGDSTVEATAAEPAAAAADATPSQPDDVPAEQVVHFEFASKDISADDSDILARHVVYLQAHPKAKLRLEGYTDSRGSERYNKALGERRARAVRDFLIQAGVKARQLVVLSYGSEKPVAEGSDEEAWAKNRRVALVYQGR